VFGVSSAEYLNYAVANRREWEMRGKDVVKDLIDKHTKPSSGRRTTRAFPKPHGGC
jgi:hypothetical protein